jgi:ferredoxin
MQQRGAQVLREGARLQLDEGACLPLRSRFGQCRACESACPVGVISVTVERVALADGCTGCGRCAAACPNEALRIEGFAVPAPAPAGAAAVELECAKVPAARRSADAKVVPCLGGLSAGRLAELTAQAGGRAIHLVDRGWCGRCSSGGGASHPAQRAVDAVMLWIEALGPHAAARQPAPKVVERPLPLTLMPEAIPPPEPAEAPAPVMTRREFLRAVAERPLGGTRTPIGGNGRAAFPGHARRPSPERGRLLGALDEIGRRLESAVPEEFFPRVTNNGACADHRVCTAACPTAALKAASADGSVELRFSGEHCIACGACVRACPEQALALEAHGGGRAPEVIARHVPRRCAQCGEEYTPRDGEALCLPCTKSRRFMNDAVGQLFGAGK